MLLTWMSQLNWFSIIALESEPEKETRNSPGYGGVEQGRMSGVSKERLL